MKLTIHNVKISGSDRRHVLDQIQKFADRFTDRKFTEVEIAKMTDGTFAILTYDLNGIMSEHKFFARQDTMIGYILGANAHMSSTHIIKELH